MRGKKSPITIIVGDAAIQNYDRVTHFLLCNPFGESTMTKVIMQIQASLLRDPRKIQLIYVNPLQEHILAQQSWLLKTGKFIIPHRVGWSLTVSTWQSVD